MPRSSARVAPPPPPPRPLWGHWPRSSPPGTLARSRRRLVPPGPRNSMDSVLVHRLRPADDQGSLSKPPVYRGSARVAPPSLPHVPSGDAGPARPLRGHWPRSRRRLVPPGPRISACSVLRTIRDDRGSASGPRVHPGSASVALTRPSMPAARNDRAKASYSGAPFSAPRAQTKNRRTSRPAHLSGAQNAPRVTAGGGLLQKLNLQVTRGSPRPLRGR
jgi:hypothetical protein